MTGGHSSWEGTIRWLREQPDQAALVESGYYDDPLELAAHRYWQSAEWQAVVSRLPKPHAGNALDFGAGRGIASFALAKTGYSVVALEADESALVGADAIRALSGQSGLPIDVKVSVSERLPFPDATFDVVFERAVLHHVHNIEVACREFWRVLKPGGTLIAIREHVISDASELPRFQALHPLHKYYGGEHAHTVDRYTSAITSAGFSLHEVIRPFRSAINLYPHSLAGLQQEVARRVCFGNRLATRMLTAVISIPAIWWVVMRAMEAVDNRPGRLYSFVARRP
jgi:ubiquinone/menaquinone biosynthesis C-methylase UbiE